MLNGVKSSFLLFAFARQVVAKCFVLLLLGLAIPALVGVFSYSTMTNWFFAEVFGGAGVFMPAGTIPFFNRDVLNYQALGLVLVGFGWFQFIAFPLAVIAWKSKQYALSVGSVCMGLIGVFLGFWAGVSYQVVSQDYAARKNTVDLAAFNTLKVKSEKSAVLTQEIAPRAAGVIEAELKQKLNRVVTVRGRSTTVGQYTNNCAKPQKLRRSCSEILSLETELAKSIAYTKNQNQASQDLVALKEAITIDVNKFYEFLGSENTLNLKKQQQDLIRHTIIQFACEFGSLFILPLILLGLGYCTGLEGQPNEPEPPAVKQGGNDAVTTQFAAQGDGQPHLRCVSNNDNEDPKIKKIVTLRRYVVERKCFGEYLPDDFMKDLNKWCVSHGLRKFHKKEVGAAWESLVGHKYKYRNGNSERTMWVIGEPQQPQLKFGGV